MTRIVYTANFGGYDVTPVLPHRYREDWKALYFTDRPESVPDGWELAVYDTNGTKELYPAMRAKILKTDPWICLPDGWDMALWLDSNIELHQRCQQIAMRWTDDFCTFSQDELADIWKEFKLLQTNTRPYVIAQREKYAAQEAAYREQGIPGLDGCGARTSVILRRNTERCKRICRRWREELQTWDHGRDQPCLRGVLHELNETVSLYPRDSIRFRFLKHCWQRAARGRGALHLRRRR